MFNIEDRDFVLGIMQNAHNWRYTGNAQTGQMTLYLQTAGNFHLWFNFADGREKVKLNCTYSFILN